MNKTFAGIALGLLILGAALFMSLKGKRPAETAKLPSSAVELSSRSGMPAGTRSSESSRARQPKLVRSSSGVAEGQVEKEITRLLSDDAIPMRQASMKLLAMAGDAAISKEMRVESLSHALNLVTDAEFGELVMPYLEANLFEDPAMQRIALDNAYNRDDVAKLPAALALFRQSEGELRTEARDLMEFVMDQDGDALGDDVNTWSRLISEHLSKVPEE